jgi:hypothetical protein
VILGPDRATPDLDMTGETVSQPTRIPLEEVDLTDLDAFARNEGWAMFDTLRAEDPVHWTPEAEPNHGFWAVTKHADI